MVQYDVVNHRNGFEAIHTFKTLPEAERFFADEVEKIGGPVELWEFDSYGNDRLLRFTRR